MKDDGHIHNCILSDGVHRVMNGIFGTVVCFTLGAVGWQEFGETPIVGTISQWLVYLAIPFGAVMFVVNPRRLSIVEGHTSSDIAFDELNDEDQQNNTNAKQNEQVDGMRP